MHRYDNGSGALFRADLCWSGQFYSPLRRFPGMSLHAGKAVPGAAGPVVAQRPDRQEWRQAAQIIAT
jgi:hypothetical protein